MKQCPTCRHDNEDAAVFCAGCGATLDQTPAQGTPQVVLGKATAVTTGNATNDAGADAKAAVKNTATLWLILNIVSTVLCCCANIFGIIGIVFGAMGVGRYNKGDYEGMKKKAKVSMILFIIAAICVPVGWLVILFGLPTLLLVFPVLGMLLPVLPILGNDFY